MLSCGRGHIKLQAALGGRLWIKPTVVVVSDLCEVRHSLSEDAAVIGRGPLGRPFRSLHTAGFIHPRTASRHSSVEVAFAL